MIAIYATLYYTNIDAIESCLKVILDEADFYRIEQGTILIYEDSWREFSIEPYRHYDGQFLVSGIIQGALETVKPLIVTITDKLEKVSIKYSLDFVEETDARQPISPEYNISNM